MNDITTTIVGNLTSDPELRFAPSGVAVVKFTVAHTPRTRDAGSGEWRDGEPTYLDCTAWRQLAENIAESLTKGSRVIVAGRLRTERWQDRDNPEQKRSRMVLDVDAIGPELSFATATVRKIRRNGAGPVDDEWASATRTRPTNGPTSSTRPADPAAAEDTAA